MSERLQAQGQDLELFRDKCLGSGAYGVVCKAKLNELPCAAKLLHRVLFHPTIQRRFDQEHVLLQSMKHPNVVQYLGVAHDPQSGQPILLMELLDGNLTDFLEHSDGPIPYHLQVNLWYDVALALTYLHSKHIIHRDLSGNNVLLIAGSRAKVSDFGMSMFTHMDVTKSRLTHCPGNANYMSPEAMMENPIYTEKLDVFSSGVVAVQIITQQFPEPTSSMIRCNDPKSPTGYSFTPVSEIERRKNHIVLIDPKHPMLPMIQSCLRDKDCERPPAQQLCHQLVSLKQAPEYAHSKRQPTPNERRIQEQQQLIQNQQREIENQRRNMQQAVQQMQTKVTKQGQVIQKQQREIEDQRREKEQAVQQMQTEITKWKGSVQVLNTQLHEKSQELQLKTQELWKTQYNLQQKTEQLQQKTEELQEQSKDLQQALQGQEFQRDKVNLIEQLPQAFVTRFTAEELPHHIKKLIEEGLQEWEGNLCKFHLFCGHPSSGDLMERKLEVHKSLTLGEVTERAYKSLELEKCGVQLEQCQLVRYNEKSGTLGKPFDEPKEMPFGEVVDEPQSFSFDLLLEIQTDPAALPQYEQEMRAIRVICINYSLIWQYLVAGNVLPKLMEKSVISVSKKQEVELYQQHYGQNAVIIDSVLDGGHAPEGLLTICDTLQTNLGKEHIAQHILRDYKRQPALRALCSPANGSTDVLSDASLQFQHLKQDLVDSLVQCPNALTQLKQCLASLVLPLGDGKVASLVDPSSYEAASTIPELFRLMAPYWNCLSTNLLSLLLEASSCKPAAAKLAEFEEARTSSGTLVLCTQTASTGELKSVHSLPLEQLHSLHPAVFTESVASEQAEQNTARITAAVSKPLLQVSCYEKTATAICGFFRLPKAALVYAGCSENPLALCWLVSRNLLSYMRNHTGSLSGYHLLAEQQITHIAFGEVEFHNCPNLKEVELCESSRYGLLERIPDLLAIVSVDVAYADGITPLWTASAHGQKKVVELLLAAGANPNQQRKDGWAPLHAASQEGHDQVVDLLLEAGASVEQETEDGQTALYIASGNGHGEIVKLLLKREADMDHETKFGDTPLGIARSQGLEHITQLLCDANKLSLTLVPTHECKKLPESIPLGLTPWQEPEKREEAELEAAAKDTMHRLNFNSKSGARSVSSDKEAHHSASRRQDSTNSLVSRDGSVCTDEILEQSNEIPVPKSPISGLIPCAPTGSEWSPLKPSSHTTRQRGSDIDIVEFQDLLRDLDKKAVEQRPHFLQARSLKSLLTTSVSWEEGAVSSQHIWHDSDTREACHVAETQFCQEQKLVHPKRTKVRCSACKMLAHVTCLHQLNYEGFTCKETFREIKHKGSGEIVVLHHFLHRRKASGRCKKCERGFGNWKKLTGKEIVGISCSWCGDSYHLSCFSDQFKREPCHLGPLRNSIIPPSWIVKVPPLERTSQGSQSDDSPKSSCRKSRRTRRRKPPTDDRASKHFTVKPFSQRQNKPLLVFINPKSGSNQGYMLMQIFQWLLNPRQVFDLTKDEPKFGLKMYRQISNFRILVCGGDGTAGWVLSVLDELDIKPSPPVAVLPLGTGNDLARVLGWGGGYTDDPLDKILMHVEEGPVVEMDRWHLSVWKNPHAHELEGQEDVPLHVINNSFSVGCDAQVALEFHLEREANPEKYKNKSSSRKIGGKEVVLRRFADLTDHLELYGDGKDLTDRIRQLRLEALCFLNIPSYGGGTNPWGTPPTRDQRMGPQKVDDGKIEIVGFWASTFLKLRMGMAHGERIAQCEHIKLITNRSLPVQIDGEACKLQPSVIEVVQKNKAMMVRKVPRRHSEAPLHGVRPSDRIKLSVSKVTCDQYERMNSDLEEIRRAAFSFGVVVATLQDTLKSLRPQIDTYTNEQRPGRKLAQNWRYLDVATGRMNRMFQVLPDQEENIYIGDMLADDIIVVELESSPVSTPESKPKILLSPVDGSEDTCIHPLAAMESHAERRRYLDLGRNKSYRMATGGKWEISLPPEPSSECSPVEEVQQQEEVQSQDSCSPSFQSPNSMESPSPKTPISLSEEENGYESDIEAMKSPLPEIADTSDSTDLDVQEPSNIQKILLDAVKRGNVVKVMESHDKGAKLTAADSYGWTPLHHAARLGKKDVVQYLVENIPREDLDIPDDEMLQTALHKAALYGYRSICKTLVDSGASLMRKDHQGYTPYHKSIQSGDPELQQYMKRREREQKTKTKDEEMPV